MFYVWHAILCNQWWGQQCWKNIYIHISHISYSLGAPKNPRNCPSPHCTRPTTIPHVLSFCFTWVRLACRREQFVSTRGMQDETCLEHVFSTNPNMSHILASAHFQLPDIALHKENGSLQLSAKRIEIELWRATQWPFKSLTGHRVIAMGNLVEVELDGTISITCTDSVWFNEENADAFVALAFGLRLSIALSFKGWASKNTLLYRIKQIFPGKKGRKEGTKLPSVFSKSVFKGF